jgi:unsaturated rhamnogalacturonyl hydrolase
VTAGLALVLVLCSGTASVRADDSRADDDDPSCGRRRSPPGAPALGVTVANDLIRRWPELDFTAADCAAPVSCFSLNFATVPASPAPKFWEYTYGVPLAALLKLHARTGDPSYLAYVKKYVDRYVDAAGTISYARSWPLSSSGKPPAPNDPTIQDVIQPSNLLFDLYAATEDPRYLVAMSNTRQIFHQLPVNGAGAFWHKPTYPNQQWLDGIYMAEPFLVRYGAELAERVAPGDAQSCFDTATTQIKLAAAHTFDPPTRLYHHAWNGAADGIWLGLPLPTRVPPLAGVEVSPVLWSRAIGWYLAAIVDVLEYLPRHHPDRRELIEIVRNIAHGLRRFQDPSSGLWYQVIDVMSGPLPTDGGYPGETARPAQANWTETSASALFAYGLAKAVRLGVLPAEYREVARRAWRGVESRVDIAADGSVVIHGTVVGLSVGGTYNAYANADFRSDLSSGPLPAPATCPTAAELPAGTTPPVECRYIYVRDNVPQGFGAILLASSELEFERDGRPIRGRH